MWRLPCACSSTYSMPHSASHRGLGSLVGLIRRLTVSKLQSILNQLDVKPPLEEFKEMCVRHNKVCVSGGGRHLEWLVFFPSMHKRLSNRAWEPIPDCHCNHVIRADNFFIACSILGYLCLEPCFSNHAAETPNCRKHIKMPLYVMFVESLICAQCAQNERATGG